MISRADLNRTGNTRKTGTQQSENDDFWQHGLLLKRAEVVQVTEKQGGRRELSVN